MQNDDYYYCIMQIESNRETWASSSCAIVYDNSIATIILERSLLTAHFNQVRLNYLLHCV